VTSCLQSAREDARLWVGSGSVSIKSGFRRLCGSLWVESRRLGLPSSFHCLVLWTTKPARAWGAPDAAGAYGVAPSSMSSRERLRCSCWRGCTRPRRRLPGGTRQACGRVRARPGVVSPPARAQKEGVSGKPGHPSFTLDSALAYVPWSTPATVKSTRASASGKKNVPVQVTVGCSGKCVVSENSSSPVP
jgi:hypothetical protein